MKLHTDTLTERDFYDAARIARVDFSRLDRKGSRSRDHGFDFTLTGESRRRPNAGTGPGDHIGPDDYAATWDQWGVFLSILFDRDPNATCAAYDGADDFHVRTDDRFDNNGNSNVVDYWPNDAHGDHRFEYAGVPFQQECSKCTARQVWGPR